MKIKVCGMRDLENIHQLIDASPDYIGFIFYPKSKRYVGTDFDAKITQSIPSSIKKVGVFVNEDIDVLISACQKYKLDFVQLHGGESVAYCQKVYENNINIIKVFSIEEQFDFNEIKAFQAYITYVLFDTKCKEYGGSGEKFNWKIIENYKLSTPLFLSGGIDIDDVDDIKKIQNLNIHAIDINSKFEIEPALKDVEKVDSFIKTMNN